MAIAEKVPEWMEIGDSGSGSVDDATDGTRSREFTLKYLMSGLGGYDAAEARLARIAPLLRRGHRRGRMNVSPVGGNWWIGDVNYRNESVVVRDAMRFGGWEWETSEKSEHITQALADNVDPNKWVTAFSEDSTPGGVRPGGDSGIPDFKGAIGVQEDKVNGLEKPVALFNWSETWTCPARYIVDQRPKRQLSEDVNGAKVKIDLSTNPLEMIVADHVFHTNKYPFRGRPPGCVLCTGIKSNRMTLGASAATLTFSFSYSPLREDFKVGPVLVAKKDGWDFMDVYYETDADNQNLVKKAKWVFIHRIFDRVDFRDLGISDPLPRWWLDEDLPQHQFNVPFGS